MCTFNYNISLYNITIKYNVFDINTYNVTWLKMGKQTEQKLL